MRILTAHVIERYAMPSMHKRTRWEKFLYRVGSRCVNFACSFLYEMIGDAHYFRGITFYDKSLSIEK